MSKRQAKDVEAVLQQYCSKTVWEKILHCTFAFHEGLMGALESMVTRCAMQSGDIKRHPVSKNDAVLSKLFKERGKSDLRDTAAFEHAVKKQLREWGYFSDPRFPLERHMGHFDKRYFPDRKMPYRNNVSFSQVEKQDGGGLVQWDRPSRTCFGL